MWLMVALHRAWHFPFRCRGELRKALESALEQRMMLLPYPPGMHRKSLEAAQQLQESEADGEASDGREDPQQQQPPQPQQQPSGEPQSEQQEQQKRQQQALSSDHHHGEAESGGFPREHPHFPMEKVRTPLSHYGMLLAGLRSPGHLMSQGPPGYPLGHMAAGQTHPEGQALLRP